ncbi:MAG: hypothetical protein KKA79_00630 [Nanoarchaeota archaeon]|nr:hypothetical protein [Nanoarchaeota archaeon]MCG2719022.1 hypothetical protein [Nanoarchaeota archaeon]
MKRIQEPTLEELITIVEKATKLKFPENVRSDIKCEYVAPKEFSKHSLEAIEYGFNKKLSENEAMSIKLGDIFSLMLASPKNNTIYVNETNTKRIIPPYDKQYDSINNILKSHELGHILLFNKYEKYFDILRDYTKELNGLKPFIEIDELFADYVMIKTIEMLKPDEEAISFIKNILNKFYSPQGWYENPLMSSKDAYGDTIKKFEDLGSK